MNLSVLKDMYVRMITATPVNAALRFLAKPVAKFVPESWAGYLPIRGNISIQVTNDINLIMANDGYDFLATLYFWKGLHGHEPETISVYLELLDRAKIVFDIGANTGIYSLIGGKFNAIQKVFAFEPVPENIALFEKNLELNEIKNVVICPMAVSSASGRTTLKIPEGIMRPISAAIDDISGGPTREISVTLVSLDEFVAEHQLDRVDLIKIDAEGHEPHVFAGAVNTLQKLRPTIICEVLSGVAENEIDRQIAAFRYKYYWLTDKGPLLRDRLVGDPTGKFKNYLLLPEEKAEHIINEIRSDS